MASPLANPLPWNLVADAYLREVTPMFEHFATDALALAAPPAGSRIVDVACGPGTLSVLAAQRGLHVDALDFSPAMIEHLEARTRELGLGAGATPARGSIVPRLGDGQALPYESGTFAAGFSMFGLMFFPDRAKGFAELRRVLAPGARAVVSSWPAMDRVPVMGAIMGALRPAFAEMMKGQAPPAAEPPPLVTEDACRSEMSAAFADVEVHAITHTQHGASADEFFDGMVRSMAPVALLKQGLGERWANYEPDARRAVRAVLGEGAVEVKLPAWLTVGTAR